MTQEEEFGRALHLCRELLQGAQDAADLGEANELCNRALRLAPRDPDAWIMKAQVLLRFEDGPAALAAALAALRRRPLSAEAHALRAAALSQMERFPEALRATQRAFRLCEEQGQAALLEELFYEKAAILDALDRTVEAVQILEEGLRRYPDSDLLRAGIEPLLRMQRRRSFQVLDGGLARRLVPSAAPDF